MPPRLELDPVILGYRRRTFRSTQELLDILERSPEARDAKLISISRGISNEYFAHQAIRCRFQVTPHTEISVIFDRAIMPPRPSFLRKYNAALNGSRECHDNITIVRGDPHHYLFHSYKGAQTRTFAPDAKTTPTFEDCARAAHGVFEQDRPSTPYANAPFTSAQVLFLAITLRIVELVAPINFTLEDNDSSHTGTGRGRPSISLVSYVDASGHNGYIASISRNGRPGRPVLIVLSPREVSLKGQVRYMETDTDALNRLIASTRGTTLLGLGAEHRRNATDEASGDIAGEVEQRLCRYVVEHLVPEAYIEIHHA